jgi:adenine/guanine/hypoxanthine permease
MVILLAGFGIISVMVALIPVVAISPILLYIGMLIDAQAFQETPESLIVSAVLVGCAKCATMMVTSTAEPTQHASASVECVFRVRHPGV